MSKPWKARMGRWGVLAALAVWFLPLRAHEGMWVPTLLKVVEGHMRSEGLQLSAEDIYSVNAGSLKDAIVHFGGGCTAEVVSKQGLILTNHHCGYGQIQKHSSQENDYLRDGFTAKDRAAELPNPGLTATFIVRMEDVTARVLEGIAANATVAEREKATGAAAEAIAKEAKQGKGIDASVRSFNFGNSWYLIVTKTYEDVRLVLAPHGAIGKFGGDEDNWMWPRHTGDFAVFRIYAGADNEPAPYDVANVPYTPLRSLKLAMDGIQAGEFSMIFGFPGRTQRYLTSEAVDFVVNSGDPLRIRMRTASLGVIDAAMRASDRTRIQYASKQSSIANGWKKWIGEVRGLKELDAVNVKRKQEAEFQAKAAGHPSYGNVLATLRKLNAEDAELSLARDNFMELYTGGFELARFAYGYEKLVQQAADLQATGKWEAELERLRKAARGFYKNYDPTVDRNVLKALLPLYRENLGTHPGPLSFRAIAAKHKGSADAWADALFSTSIFADSVKLYAFLDKANVKSAGKLANDPALVLARELVTDYQQRIYPRSVGLRESIDDAMRIYVAGQAELFPERITWPDANSTLRLSYGKVEGSKPRDGVVYEPFTTLAGVLAKDRPGDPDFEVPAKLKEVVARGDFAPYGKGTDLPVCFTSSLHTTGGNSGSPVLNGRGELIGINFDRTWESTMSDILFDPDKCRNIAVDIRYVLFIIDKVCNGKHIVDEMELVQAPKAVQKQ